MFKVWLALPPIFRNNNIKRTDDEATGTVQEVIQKRLAAIGIDDPLVLQVCGISSATAFRKWALSVDKKAPSEQILSAWRGEIEEADEHTDLWNKIKKKLTPNVDASFYNKLMTNPTAPDYIAWYKLVHGWKDTNNTEAQRPLVFLMGAYDENGDPAIKKYVSGSNGRKQLPGKNGKK